jgi:UDP-N-acetyl-D-mannosaminuronate dehydrogenase
VVEKDLAKAIRGAEAVILAVPHEPYLQLDPDQIVQWAGAPLAVIDCFGILPDNCNWRNRGRQGWRNNAG